MPNNPKSTAQVRGHPVHPMLIPLPIAFLIGGFASDLAFWATRNGFWAEASLWLIGAGIVTALLAALFGFADFFGEGRIRDISYAWYHMLGNLAAVVVAVASFWLRYARGVEAAVLPWGLVLSLATVCLLLFTGWCGGEMVYRHRVGVADRDARVEEVRNSRRAA
jgi:uncharacterized membrane protein